MYKHTRIKLNYNEYEFYTLLRVTFHMLYTNSIKEVLHFDVNGNRGYKYLVLGREGPYFVKEHSDS